MSNDIAECALCRTKKKLVNSHIIPSFVGKYIKETSATGLLRKIEEPNARIQDLIKKPLLCKSCEDIFSKYEKYFAEKIFIPLNQKCSFQKSKCNFKYNENLLKYIISQSWRILYSDYDEYFKDKLSSEGQQEISKVIDDWRLYLLNKTNWNEQTTHYLFFWTYISITDIEIPNRFEFYIKRDVDGTIASDKEKKIIIVFTQIPSISIISAIRPRYLLGWEDAEIFKEGIIGTPQSIDSYDLDFNEFIIGRAKKIQENKMSEGQQQKILEAILKNPERFKISKTFEAFSEEFRRRDISFE